MAVNVAVVGLGKMGISHLAIANSLQHFNVSVICDSSKIVGQVLQKYTGLKFVDSFDDAISEPGLEAVIIATPTAAHELMVRKAVDRGLHIFCEKPLTLSSKSSREIAAAASNKNLVTQAGYHNRFVGTFCEVKRLLDAGVIGDVSHVRAEAYGPVVLKPVKATWRSQAGSGGGCLYDYAAHPVNLLNWYFGEPSACSGTMIKSGYSANVDDEVYASMRFNDGVTGQLSVNWSDPSVRKMSTRISLWGTGGVIHVDRQEMQVFLNGHFPVPLGYNEGWTVKHITSLTPPVSFYLRGEEYSAQIEHFGNSILTKIGENQNNFFSASITDSTIEMIRAASSCWNSERSFSKEIKKDSKTEFLKKIWRR